MKRILKSGWKRIISFVLVLTLLMSTLPMAVFAQLLENDAEYNEEILTALSEVVGSDEEAEKYYEILQQYGLLAEDGSAPESWEIWLDGEQVTLDDIKALLADENCDLDRVLLVDGVPITLGEIKTILEIEEYIAYLRETYFTDHQWTAEQRASLMSLVEQIDNEGIMLLAEGDSLIGESGINHSARVSVSNPSVNGTTATFTATLANGPESLPVTFNYTALSGSQTATGSGTVTFNAGETSKTFTVQIPAMSTGGNNPVRSTANLVYYVKLDNIKNALFEDDKDVLTVKCTTDKTVDAMLDAFTISGTTKSAKAPETYTHTLSSLEKNAIAWGTIDGVTISQNGFDINSSSIKLLSANGSTPQTLAEFQDKAFYATTAVSMFILGADWSASSGGNTWQGGSYTYDYKTNNGFLAVNLGRYLTLSEEQETRQPVDANNVGETVILSFEYKVLQKIPLSFDGNLWKTRSINVTDELRESDDVEVTASFNDRRTPSILNVSATAGTYYPGNVVPVTVTFSEPVNAIDTKVKFNGGSTEYAAVENDGCSNVLTFPYLVQEVDNTTLSISSITTADTSKNTLSDYNPGGDAAVGQQISGVTLDTPNEVDAVTGITSGNITAGDEVITVKVNISSNEKLTTWLAAAEFEQIDGGGFQTKASVLSVSIDGGTTKYPLVLPGESVTGQTLTAEIPVGKNSGGERSFVPELYVNGEIAVGKAVSVTQGAFVPVEASDVTTSLTVKNADGEDDYVFENGASPVVYVQSGMPKITAAFAVASGKNYTFADTSNVTTADASGTFADENADFAWQATEKNVVNLDIQNNGSVVISPKGSSGSTKINLLVRNGGVDGYQYTIAATYAVYTADGKYDKDSDTLTFASGLTPFLEISGKKINSISGKDATVYWMSNLSEKGGDSGMVFTVKAQRGNSEAEADNKTITLLGTPENPAGSVTIPGDFLTFNYAEGVSNTFTVTVSAEYAGVVYSDTAEISLESAPANVAFEKLPSYYITDAGGSVNISWLINNFDKFSTDDSGEKLFEFEVMKNGTSLGKVNEPGTETSEGSGVFNGTYTIDDIDVTATDKPDSYRDVYTVTIRVKNGTDSTWSFDSFMLYVYDAEALKIMVDGKTAGSSLTMSNISEISKMSQSQILSLKRDIYLKNIISVNYGEYAWTEVADQIAWASSNNSAATLNYQQGTLYEDINNFSYVSYRPTTDLGLSGISNGKSLISAVHKLTGMTDELNVNVETLENKLYLFQCYPQVKVKLSYTNGNGETKTHESDETGAAAIYEESGIASDVYCVAKTADGITYLGTFYNSSIKTGEGDWTKLEKYPCNNLELRRAAYAYMYLKTPEDKPFTGDIVIRGGVYVNGTYRENGLFGFNSNSVTKKGNEDNKLSLGKDGRLEIVMDQTQWGLPDNAIRANDEVSYVFQIELADDDVTYYPMFITINATENQDAFVGNGEAVVNFRKNVKNEKHSFIAQQVSYNSYSSPVSLLNHKGNVGPTDALPESYLNTVVMWWGDNPEEITPKVQLTTDSGKAIAAGGGQFTLENSVYPFSDMEITQYEVKLNAETLNGIAETGKKVSLRLDYYKDGEKVSRQETLNFTLVNMLELGKVEESSELAGMIAEMGNATGTSAQTNMDFGDEYVQIALNLVGQDSYTGASSSAFTVQIVPTADPTKFLGLIQVNAGKSADDLISAVYEKQTSEEGKFKKKPGLSEMMMLSGRKSPMEYTQEQLKKFNEASKGKGKAAKNFTFGGYAETLIYYNYDSGKWEMQSLSGGFNAGGGMSYTWNWNTMVGPIPFTASLSIGGMAEISYDTLAVAYRNDTTLKDGIGTDMLTELRIYLYLKFFAGVGIDYAVIAFKLGIYGQIDLDMQFQWLNRPYMYDTSQVITNYADGLNNQSGESRGGKMNGQHFEINGIIGLQFVLRFLFISYEKLLFSYEFNLLNESTGQWETIHTSWEKNQAAKQAVISELLSNGSASLMSVGGQRMLTLNLAPTLESRAYVDEGSYWNDGGISLFALDRTSALENLHYNTYPYANPVVSEDGYLVAYLADMGSTDVTDTRAAFATKNGNSYTQGESGDTAPINNGGEGDTQVSLAGTKDFAVSAWARQTESLEKDEGSVITDDDQMILINSSEVYAAVYNGNSWTTTQLTGNSSPDLAPVVAAGDGTAIVAWRAVSTSGSPIADEAGNSFAGVTNFDEKDTILYKVYDGSAWGETKTLYNGTSGAVKGIVASMMDDGTAAVAYTLDGDKSDTTITDREVYYSVIDKENGNEVVRNVRATNDAYLDENPQLATVKFPSADNEERFVLGWYAEQGVASDDAAVMDSGSDTSSGETTSDIRLIDFNATGVTEQLLPDSISQVSASYGVAITPTFRFTKGAETINDLSILWVQRAEGMTSGETASADTVEKDVLKGVKFYTYGENSEMIRFTGAVDVAEMEDGTLIDHFDAYVSDAENNEIKAVILGTTYGADGIQTVTGQTVAGDTVQYNVPSSTTSMYTATETYTDKIEVPAVIAEYETVKKGGKTQIQFTIENNGIHAVKQLNIKVGDTETVYGDGTENSELNLLPGSSIQLYADYDVPADEIVDPEYVVTATFDSSVGASGDAETEKKAEGVIYLDLPDVEITDTTIVKEENGERTVQVKLNNASDATLNKNNRKVKISFYADATYEKEISALPAIEIADSDSLEMIGEGGFSVQTTFNVQEYLTEISEDSENPLTEIPSGGITVYVKSEIIEGDESIPEPISSNNYGYFVCENLKARTGKDVSITTDLSVSESGSTVDVSLQNNSLSATTTGNVIVTLLDEGGNVLDMKQSYTGEGENGGLLTLGSEQKSNVQFSFDDQGASVQVMYSSMVMDDDNTTLTNLSFTNIPDAILSNFVWNEDAGQYEYSVEMDGLTATTVIATMESTLSKAYVSVDGGEWSEGSVSLSNKVDLEPGSTHTIKVRAEAHNKTAKIYALTVKNNAYSVTAPTFVPDDYGVETFEYGYAAFDVKPITIAETLASVDKVELTGDDADSFELIKGDSSDRDYSVKPKDGLDAGTYNATVTATYSSGETASGAISFVVVPKVIDAVTLTNKVYTGSTLTADIPENDGYTVVENKGGINVGKCRVELALSNTNNYVWYDNTTTNKELWFDIIKADSVITPGKGELSATYGDIIEISAMVSKAPSSRNTFSLMAVEPVKDKVKFYCGENLLGEAEVTYASEYDDAGIVIFEYNTSDKLLKIGENTITAVYGGSINLNDTQSSSIKVTLGTKDITVEITPNGGTYADTITAATAEPVDFIDGYKPDVTLTYTGTANDGTEINSTDVPSKAGNYVVSATVEDKYYNLTGTNTAEFVINKGTFTPALSAAEGSISARPGKVILEVTVPADATGTADVYEGETKLATLTLAETNKYTFVPTEERNAYSFTVKYPGDANYTASESVAFAYDFSKSNQTELAIADVGEKTFGNEAFALSVSGGSGTGAVSYAVTSGSSVSVDENGNVTILSAGESIITVTKAGDNDYNEAVTTVTINIAQAQPSANTEKATTARLRRGRALKNASISKGEFFALDGETVLEGTFTWIEPEKTLSEDSTERIKFTPTDTNYAEIEFDVAVDTYSGGSSGGGSSSSATTTTYTVTFETNGGSKIDSVKVTKNNTVSEPTAPTKDGYTFDGWYTDKELTMAYDFDTKVTKAITLYAKWTEDKKDDTDDKTDDKTDTPDAPVWENPFEDVKSDDWYYKDVEYAVKNGLFNGTTTTTFAPNGIITRAMMVTVLYRAEGEPTVTGTATFEDVDTNAYYAKAVVWGQQNGIIKGYSETEFAPDQNITREQIAAIMHRYAQYKGYDVSVGENTNILSYSDYDSISDYAIASMQYAVGSGLMKGKTASTLNPLDNATRAEIAAILHRFIEANK